MLYTSYLITIGITCINNHRNTIGITPITPILSMYKHGVVDLVAPRRSSANCAASAASAGPMGPGHLCGQQWSYTT